MAVDVVAAAWRQGSFRRMFTKRQSGSAEDVGVPMVSSQVTAPPPPRPAAAKSETPFAGIKSDGVLLVGKGTRLIGEISDCTLVEVQGVVEGKLLASTVIIREGGGFKGSLQADQAEIHGVMEGNAVINDLLDIRATGTVAADLAYGRLSVEAGGQMTGNILARISIENGSRMPASSGAGEPNGTAQHYSET
jgi:cytoskeletal protein CcmA (bactofilin family)